MDNYPRKRRAYSQPDSLSAPVDRLPYFPTPPLDDIPEYVQYAPPLKNIGDHPQVDSLSNFVGVTPYTGPIYQSDLNPRYANGYADSYADGLPSTPLDNYQSAKRPRRSTNFSMAPPQSAHPSSQDGHENLHPLNGLTLRSNATNGWTMSRIAHCFANPFMCPQSDVGDSPPPAYREIPTPYDCLPSRAPPMLDTSSAPCQAQVQAPPMSAQMVPKQVGMHVCNELEWQRVAEKWPPLQPSQVVGFQPHTGREEMIYPSPPPYGLSTPYYNTSPSIKSETASSAYFGSSGHGSPYEQHQDAYANIPVSAHYHETQGCAAGETVEQQVDGQGGQTVLDLVPHKGPSKRKAFSDPELRAKTAQTRKIGSCIRCRMQRIRCVLDEENQTGPCLPCKRAMANSRVPKFDCIRRKIPDVKLFKPGQVPGFEWTSRWKGNIVENIETWVSKSRRYIYVTEGYTGKSVRLVCGEFVPQEGDKIVRTWVDSDGVTQKRVIPSYAIADMDAAKQGFVDYVSSKRGVMECCRKLMSEKLFLHKTYGLAIEKRYTATTETERNVLGNTLDLWMSIRMTTKSFEIVGQDKLGMPDNIINDPTQDLYNKIPIPPVMGAQIDMILIHEIQPQLRRKVLDDLQKLVLKKDAYTWMTVYLVCFILLHNAALITEHDAKYARKHGMDRRFAREGEVIDYNSSATTLLAYFHYVNRGVYPFSDECNDIDLMNLARLNSDEMELVRFSRQFAVKHKEDWEGLWTGKCYENEYFYLSQLFEQNWEAKPWAV